MIAEKYEKKIEAAALLQKTKEQLRTFLDGKEITDAQFKEILERVNKEYLSTRIEACEAVGVIAAQSIGEPGTQMTMGRCRDQSGRELYTIFQLYCSEQYDSIIGISCHSTGEYIECWSYGRGHRPVVCLQPVPFQF